ncbi:hypothetical protein CDD82_5131 [Ophiocordyceps australis]|uniref:Uncharacterized protein n=1 Tax=Ophiocordyceps australis TaxID=1399860 RepID=A0A2C5YZ43_9HYPO|nr:hypothetical protein CDD82_5131 [Ophiocordyceps australis]
MVPHAPGRLAQQRAYPVPASGRAGGAQRRPRYLAASRQQTHDVTGHMNAPGLPDWPAKPSSAVPFWDSAARLAEKGPAQALANPKVAGTWPRTRCTASGWAAGWVAVRPGLEQAIAAFALHCSRVVTKVHPPPLHHCTTAPLHHCTAAPLHRCTTAQLPTNNTSSPLTLIRLGPHASFAQATLAGAGSCSPPSPVPPSPPRRSSKQEATTSTTRPRKA